MLFKDAKIGTRFFDGFSGEYFIKITENTAKIDSTSIMDSMDWEQTDEFSENDEIDVA